MTVTAGSPRSSARRARPPSVRAVLVAAVVAAFTAAPANVEAASSVDFSFTFNTTKPRTPADAALHILYKDPRNPDDPNGKSPPLTSVRIAAPPGTVFDGAAVPACRASDAELMLSGRAACPPASNVGGGFGSVVLDPGPPDPFTARVTLFNYRDGIIELLEFLGGGVKTVDRARFEGQSTMVLHPRVVPGFTEREFSFTYRGMPSGSGKPFITTPPDCSPSRTWTSRLTYTVTTGTTYSARSTSACSPSASRPAAIRASVRPRRVRAGRRVRFRVRLRSTSRRCIEGAAVRLPGGRRVRTNRRGRAKIVVKFRRTGRRTLSASKRGCASGRAKLTVLPRRR